MPTTLSFKTGREFTLQWDGAITGPAYDNTLRGRVLPIDESWALSQIGSGGAVVASGLLTPLGTVKVEPEVEFALTAHSVTLGRRVTVTAFGGAPVVGTASEVYAI